MGSVTRRTYTPLHIRRQVHEQGHECFYCHLPFGTVVRHHGTEIVQRPEGDHFEPWALNRRTRESNLVAACQVCNRLKGSRVFESVEVASKRLLAERFERGYRVWFVPSVALTASEWGWAEEYAAWLID